MRDGTGNVLPSREIPKNTDLAAIHAWLNEYDNPSTQLNYRKEAYRFYKWCMEVAEKPLSSLTRADFDAYKSFMAAPPSNWCGRRRPLYKRQSGGYNDQWAPFMGPLDDRSIRQALVIINSLLSWLVDARYLASNPLSLMRRRRVAGRMGGKRSAKKSERILEDKALEAIDHILPSCSVSERWLYSLMRYSALRRTEVAAHTMGSFIQIQRNGRARWYFDLTGKGGVEARLPVNSHLLEALIDFRSACGLPPLPAPGEERALVSRKGGYNRLSSRTLYEDVKRIMAKAADWLEANDPDDLWTVRALRAASPHWLRHTTATRLLRAGADPKEVQLLLRHASFSTTAGYLHFDDDSLYATMERHRDSL